jgi:hypothetical protein
MFHLPVAIATIALDITVLACSGYQTHKHLHLESCIMVLTKGVTRCRGRSPCYTKKSC